MHGAQAAADACPRGRAAPERPRPASSAAAGVTRRRAIPTARRTALPLDDAPAAVCRAGAPPPRRGEVPGGAGGRLRRGKRLDLSGWPAPGQCFWTGHNRQLGDVTRHTVAPSSIRAWLKSPGRSSGTRRLAWPTASVPGRASPGAPGRRRGGSRRAPRCHLTRGAKPEAERRQPPPPCSGQSRQQGQRLHRRRKPAPVAVQSTGRAARCRSRARA